MERKFIESSYYQGLHNDIAHSYRQAGHALDNYGVDMSTELKKALEELYTAHRVVLEVMDKDRNV